MEIRVGIAAYISYHLCRPTTMSQTQTISASPSFSPFHRLYLDTSSRQSVLYLDPAEVVDIALQKLQKAGVELIEWRSLLYRRMNVPVVLVVSFNFHIQFYGDTQYIQDYSYVVSDERLEDASAILSAMGLPIAAPSRLLLRTEGDFQAKGRFHRITRSTSVSSVQHLVLYPLSFSTLLPSELDERAPFHTPSPSTRGSSIYVPSRPALYASIIRLMVQYDSYDPTIKVLQSDLSELIGYDLLRLDGYVDPNDDVEWELKNVDKRLAEAAEQVLDWEYVWRKGEEWIRDALSAIVAGTGCIEYLPHKE